MSLKVYDSNNSHGKPKGMYIRLNKSGQHTVSSGVRYLMDLEPGYRIIFLQEVPDDPTDIRAREDSSNWYVQFSTTAGLPLRKANGNSLVFNSAGILRAIEKSLELEVEHGRGLVIPVGETTVVKLGRECLPLITRYAKDHY